MGNSLRDQLLKGGLVTKKQAKAAAAEVRKDAHSKRKSQKSGLVIEDDISLSEAEKIREETAERDRELNRQREEERLEHERHAQVRDLVKKNKIDYKGGEISHNFGHGTHVKSLHVNDEIHKNLCEGRIGIIFLDDAYHLVPESVAEKILDRVPEAVILLNTRDEDELGEDDPYADYTVPDDMMW